jgi:hypothetical protein
MHSGKASSRQTFRSHVKDTVRRGFACEYFILRNRGTGELRALRDGFIPAPFICNLLCLGWLWAFVNGCFVFGWQIIGVTVASPVVAYVLRITHGDAKSFATIVGLSWFGFAFVVAHRGNSWRASALLHRGFELLSSSVIAINA